MIELWPVFNKETNLFDRIVWDRWRIRRQQVVMCPETGRVRWIDVPLWRRK